MSPQASLLCVFVLVAPIGALHLHEGRWNQTRANYAPLSPPLQKLLEDALQFTYDHHYSRNYDPEPPSAFTKRYAAKKGLEGEEAEAAALKEWKFDTKPEKGCGIVRHNHALAHAVRKVVLLPFVAASLAKQHKSHNQLTEKHEFALMLAVAFMVVGRRSEIGFGTDAETYQDFQAHSRASLRNYIRTHREVLALLGDPGTDGTLASDILDALRHLNTGKIAHNRNIPDRTILELTHDLDLPRCVMARRWGFVFENLVKHVGKAEAEDLAARSIALMDAHGNRYYVPTKVPEYDCEKFIPASTDVKHSLKVAMEAMKAQPDSP